MRSAIWTSAAALLVLLPGCGEPPPSLLLVTLDTLRRDYVGAYGGGGDLTPQLDALAAEGLVHEAAYTTMPSTGPAHLSLFTGLYPVEHTGRRNGEPLPSQLAERELARKLQRRGYATAAFVTSLMVVPAATGLRGFEVYDAPRGRLRHGEQAVDAALAWLDAERRRPVFLWVHLYDPHAPYGTADEKRLAFPFDHERYGWIDPALFPDDAALAEMRERYGRGIRSADAALGRLVSGVRERLERPPLVVVAADHGESLAEHLVDRGFAYDHGEFLDPEAVQIPLVLAGPGVTPGRSRGAVSIRDLYTTLLGAAGLGDPTASAEGRRDLRAPDDARRVVRVERRRFVKGLRELVRTHAAAASDGARLVIVAEDGSATLGVDEGSADLLAEARDVIERLGPSTASRPIDASTRRALHELGYAE